MGRILSFIYGAALGGAIGAAVGLLLAPASGEDTRVQIQERARNARSEIQTAASMRRAELERQLSDLRVQRTEK